MKIIIGLGNPGKKYENTRHNAGFATVDELREKWNFPDFKFNKNFNAEISKKNVGCQISDVKCLLIKPMAFMNRSGEAVKKIMNFYKLTPADVIVIHDDLDIEIGKYKIAADSRAAGHHGVQNIIDELGNQNFTRARIGVETKGGRQNRRIPGEDFVLQKFTEEEKEKIKNIQKDVLKEIGRIAAR